MPLLAFKLASPLRGSCFWFLALDESFTQGVAEEADLLNLSYCVFSSPPYSQPKLLGFTPHSLVTTPRDKRELGRYCFVLPACSLVPARTINYKVVNPSFAFTICLSIGKLYTFLYFSFIILKTVTILLTRLFKESYVIFYVKHFGIG